MHRVVCAVRDGGVFHITLSIPCLVQKDRARQKFTRRGGIIGGPRCISGGGDWATPWITCLYPYTFRVQMRTRSIGSWVSLTTLYLRLKSCYSSKYLFTKNIWRGSGREKLLFRQIFTPLWKTRIALDTESSNDSLVKQWNRSKITPKMKKNCV